MFSGRSRSLVKAAVAALGLLTSVAMAQTPLGTAFTYQGLLKHGDAPLDGSASIEFRLYADAASVSPVASVPASTVEVAGGLFSVPLDFGAAAFNGEARWLEVVVDSNPLTPRQPITLAPYALQTRGLFVDDAGRVGIGTTSPGARVGIVGDAAYNSLEVSNPGINRSAIWGDNTATQGTLTSGVRGSSVSGNGLLGLSSGGYGVRAQTSSTPHAGVYGENLATTGAGYGVRGRSLSATGYGGYFEGRGYFSGTVGIGTSSPSATLDVIGRARFQQGTDPSAGFWLKQNTSPTGNGNVFVGMANDMYVGFYGEGPAGQFAGWGLVMNRENGNVGIGTLSPQQKLEVNGTTRTKVLQITGGSDVAEPYLISATGGVSPAPGMVVTIDPVRTGALRVADCANDPTVAGIISGANGINPGLTLAQEGTVADGSLPVANVGRVWCWVDAATGGPIKPGDLLTTSSTPGHAMRVIDRAASNGAILGKAMSSLDNGRGLVLVLVALQ